MNRKKPVTRSPLDRIWRRADSDDGLFPTQGNPGYPGLRRTLAVGKIRACGQAAEQSHD